MNAKESAIHAIMKLSEADAAKVLVFLAGMEAGKTTTDSADSSEEIKTEPQEEARYQQPSGSNL